MNRINRETFGWRWIGVGGALALVLCLGLVVAWAAVEGNIVGRWKVPDGKSCVEIYRASDGTIEGRICWLRQEKYPAGDAEQGKPIHDRDNPDKALAGRPLMGLVVMKGFKFDGKGQWAGGTLYDPQCGKTYKGKLWLEGGTTLNLRGYVGVSLFGRTEKWMRDSTQDKETARAGL
jgi:uncharacterized protein (DUF2147 family)